MPVSTSEPYFISVYCVFRDEEQDWRDVFIYTATGYEHIGAELSERCFVSREPDLSLIEHFSSLDSDIEKSGGFEQRNTR